MIWGCTRAHGTGNLCLAEDTSHAVSPQHDSSWSPHFLNTDSVLLQAAVWTFWHRILNELVFILRLYPFQLKVGFELFGFHFNEWMNEWMKQWNPTAAPYCFSPSKMHLLQLRLLFTVAHIHAERQSSVRKELKRKYSLCLGNELMFWKWFHSICLRRW